MILKKETKKNLIKKGDKRMNNVVLLNCVGYSLGQCYDSNIEILTPIDNDSELLDNLKQLAQSYKDISSKMSDKELEKVCWSFPAKFINDILNATCVDELYKK
jgi:hypothetical protein